MAHRAPSQFDALGLEMMDTRVKWIIGVLAVATILLIVGVVFGVGWAQSHLLEQVDQYAAG